MAAADLRELPVVSKEDPTRVVSIVSRKEIIRTYHDEIERMKKTGYQHCIIRFSSVPCKELT